MLRICKTFDVTGTIYQDSERPENILKQFFLEVQISYIQTITSINKLQKNLCTFTLMMGAVKLIIIKDNFSRQEKKAGLVILTGFTQHSSWVDQGRLGRNTRFWLLQLRLDLITFKVLPYSEIVVIGPNP